jgi:hypothetical protein
MPTIFETIEGLRRGLVDLEVLQFHSLSLITYNDYASEDFDDVREQHREWVLECLCDICEAPRRRGVSTQYLASNETVLGPQTMMYLRSGL